MLEQAFEQYNALTLKIKAVFLVAIVALTAYYSYQESVETAFTALEQAKQADEQLSTEFNSLNKGGQSLAAIESQIRKSQEELAQLFELIPKTIEIDRIIASFADAARDSGVSMTRFAPTATSSTPTSSTPAPSAQTQENTPQAAPTEHQLQAQFIAENLQGFSISLTLEGTFAQVAIFFDRILSLPRVVQLKKFTLTPATQTVSVAMPQGMSAGATQKTRVGTDNSPILKVEAQFTVFTQREGAKLATTATTPRQTPPPAVSGTTNPPDGLSAKPVSGEQE